MSGNSREFIYFRHIFDIYTSPIFNIEAGMTVSVFVVGFGKAITLKHSQLYHCQH